MKAWNYLRKTLDLPLHLQAIIFLCQLVILKDTWKMQFLDFIKLKKMIQLWLLHIYLETLSI